MSVINAPGAALPAQGRVSDLSGIQFRMLNASKGPAVRGPRAQMDRLLYKRHIQAVLGRCAQRLEVRRAGQPRSLIRSMGLPARSHLLRSCCTKGHIKTGKGSAHYAALLVCERYGCP